MQVTSEPALETIDIAIQPDKPQVWSVRHTGSPDSPASIATTTSTSTSGSLPATNLSQARVGNSGCWGTFMTLQDYVIESTKRRSLLSAKVVGKARIGVGTFWNKFSAIAWEVSMPEVDGKESLHSTVRITDWRKYGIFYWIFCHPSRYRP